MRFFRNIALMMAVNFGILITLSIVLNLLGVQPYLREGGLDMSALLQFCFVWGMGGAVLSLLLSKFMAKMMMGVKIIDSNTSDPGARRIYEMVRRLSERAGLPKTPEVGVYDSPEMNAFATGPSARSALVAVSTGLLNSMNEREVEGVIGHELSHVANGDMITLTLIQGIVNALVMFVSRVIAGIVANTVEERNRYWVRFAIITLGEILFGILGVMVTAWFSRYREFRADAGGARVAGRDNMIAALEALRDRQRALDPRAPEMAAFKISSKPKGGLLSLLMTHPPLDERIAALRRGAT